MPRKSRRKSRRRKSQRKISYYRKRSRAYRARGKSKRKYRILKWCYGGRRDDTLALAELEDAPTDASMYGAIDRATADAEAVAAAVGGTAKDRLSRLIKRQKNQIEKYKKQAEEKAVEAEKLEIARDKKPAHTAARRMLESKRRAAKRREKTYNGMMKTRTKELLANRELLKRFQ